MAKDDTTDTGTTAKPLSEMTVEELTALFGSSGNTGGANYLQGYAYPARVIAGLQTIEPNAQDYVTVRGGGGTKRSYTGPLLVNEKQQIERQPYDLSPLTDANTVLLSLAKNPTQLKYYTNLLQTRGYYGSSKPTATRTDNTDRSAIAEFLNFANSQGVTYKLAFQMLEGMPQVKAAGTKAPSIRVTSQSDLDVVFRKTAQELLGYELPPEVAQRFGKAYNQLEISEGQQAAAGGVYQAAAAPGTVAEQQILKQFAPEAQSFAAGNYAEIMDRRIKELGA